MAEVTPSFLISDFSREIQQSCIVPLRQIDDGGKFLLSKTARSAGPGAKFNARPPIRIRAQGGKFVRFPFQLSERGSGQGIKPKSQSIRGTKVINANHAVVPQDVKPVRKARYCFSSPGRCAAPGQSEYWKDSGHGCIVVRWASERLMSPAPPCGMRQRERNHR